MSEVLRSWIIGIAGAAMVSAAAMTVTPEGRVKKVVSLVCGLVVMIALLRPVATLDRGALLDSIRTYEQDVSSFSSEIISADENLTRHIIADKSAAYILDKGKSLGITDLDVAVTTAWNEAGYWYPSGAVLTSEAGDNQKRQLSQSIEAEFGIPPEELIWSMHDED